MKLSNYRKKETFYLLDCWVSKLSNSAWPILFKVCISIPRALATLAMSNPKDFNNSIKSISSPVKGLWSFGQEWLHCGQVHLSIKCCWHFWGRLTADRALFRLTVPTFGDLIGRFLFFLPKKKFEKSYALLRTRFVYLKKISHLDLSSSSLLCWIYPAFAYFDASFSAVSFLLCSQRFFPPRFCKYPILLIS